VFRILIASPSDVDEEREIVVRVIQEWNDLYSYTRRVALLPLRWETHTAPEYGVRPQEVINRAIVDNCDLLVGVFWTRIGTPTGIADSGTLEEINRVAKAGKPVMLYFSRVGADPDQLDLAQLTRLKEFKANTYPNALTESFKSQIEFRDKFAKQLELKVRELQTADESGQPPAVSLAFATDDLKGGLAGTMIEGSVKLLQVPDLDKMLAREPTEKLREFLTNEVQLRITRAATLPIVLGISNTGSQGIRNLYVDMMISASNANVEVFDSLPATSHHWGLSPWSTTFSSYSFVEPDAEPQQNPWQEGLREEDQGWRLSFEWDALQPKRVRFIQPRLFIRASSDVNVNFVARVFADSFPQPLPLSAALRISTELKRMTPTELLPDLDSLRLHHDQIASATNITTRIRR